MPSVRGYALECAGPKAALGAEPQVKATVTARQSHRLTPGGEAERQRVPYF